MRNLMAHFVVRRFPNDDAFVFVTNSIADFKRVLGVPPEPHMVMAGVADVAHTKQVMKVIQRLLNWLSQATHEVATDLN